MHHQQQAPFRHQFHPYLPLPPLRQQHHGNLVINQQQQLYTTGTSKIVKSFVASAATTPAFPPSTSTAVEALQKSQCIPVGASPSYIVASTTIDQFYQFRDPPKLIARTNHSTVQKVFSNMYEREVAVKIIDKRAIPTEVVDKFLPRELEITRFVHHPHLVRCLHIIQPTKTKVGIISEFCSGGTLLQHVLKQNHLDGPESARIFRQLCEALHYLHNTCSIVHRDIKMENILMDDNKDVKLADFGFARYISKAQASKSYCGTRPYSCPQIIHQQPYNPFAADWYAAGVVLFTMLSGKWPYEPKGKCFYPLQYPKDFDEDAIKIIDQLMHPEEDQRAGYYDVVNSEWMKKQSNGKWFISDDLFVYDVQSPLV